MKSQNIDVKSLLKAYNKTYNCRDCRKILNAKRLDFIGLSVKTKDVYNITAPFTSAGREYIAGRVESKKNEYESQVMFFKREGKDDAWMLDEDAPVFRLQDPFVCIIGNELIFGGVEIIFEQDAAKYFTVFFRGKDIYNLKLFATGPIGMKDIRLVSMPNGSVGLFTRPQGVIGGKGRIGFMSINSIDILPQLKSEDYFAAQLLTGDFHDDEWLGVNAAYILKNGSIGVLGHIARYSNNTEDDKKDNKKKLHKNYYPITFMFNPKTNIFTGMKIIVTRDYLPPGRSKAETLRNVLFAGGLVRCDDGTAIMYTGVGDAESYEIKMIDPFLEYEPKIQ